MSHRKFGADTVRDNVKLKYRRHVFQIAIGVLTGIALIFSSIRTWSYYKRDHNGNLNIAVLLWFLIYAMGAVGNIITLVCIGVCIYILVFYKGQAVPYILLPDDTSEKRIRTYITVAFGFKVCKIISCTWYR